MKILNIETQAIEQPFLIETILTLAKEAGYTNVHDYWGHKAYDDYTIDEAIDKFKIQPENTPLDF